MEAVKNTVTGMCIGAWQRPRYSRTNARGLCGLSSVMKASYGASSGPNLGDQDHAETIDDYPAREIIDEVQPICSWITRILAITVEPLGDATRAANGAPGQRSFGQFTSC